MRFAAVVAIAGAAVAHANKGAEPESTHYETQYFTVTKCDATVTNCPASSTQVSSTIIPVVSTTDSLPIKETPEPEFSEIPSHSVPQAPHGNVTVPAGVTPEPTLTPIVTSSALPLAETPGAEECGTQSIETISTYVVTTISTVSYITHSAPCEETPTVPSVPVTTPHVPSNGTATIPPVPIPTGAASSIGASFALAAVAGAIALFA